MDDNMTVHNMEASLLMRPGDIVYLRSGSPAMTVTEMKIQPFEHPISGAKEEIDLVNCVCWDNNKGFAQLVLPIDALTKDKPDA